MASQLTELFLSSIEIISFVVKYTVLVLVCILYSVCGLQSAICTQSAFCTASAVCSLQSAAGRKKVPTFSRPGLQSAVCGLQSAFCTDRLEIADVWFEEYKRFPSSMLAIRSIIVVFVLLENF